MTDYAELKRLAEAATQGKWTHEQDSLYFYEDGYTKHLMELAEGDDVGYGGQKKNADFIASANPATVLALISEIDRLRGIQPAYPPRPPEGHGLPRYGLRWNGPQQPLAVLMDDGYWTPWHLANQLIAEIDGLKACIASDEKKLDALLEHCDDGECAACGQIICPHGDGMHFHHDGCPSCAQEPGR